MSLAALVESALWAAFYAIVGALPTFQAANGILMFGWTTAIIVAVRHRVFLERGGHAK